MDKKMTCGRDKRECEEMESERDTLKAQLAECVAALKLARYEMWGLLNSCSMEERRESYSGMVKAFESADAALAKVKGAA